MSTPREYADAVKSMSEDYCDYENMHIDWESPSRYELIASVGRGKFSEVFKAMDTATNEYVSIKHLKPIRRRKIRREIKILQNLRGNPYIIPILGVVKDPDTGSPNLVTKWVNTINYRDFYPTLSDYEFRYYLYKMLIGLDYAHSHGIMHRDIKPQNVLIDYKTRDVYIIDWGLADFYIPNKKYNVRVSTRNYKGPELLTNNELYDYSVDMWSFGCMIAGIVFNRIPFFRARDNVEQLKRIAEVLGTENLVRYIKKYDLNVDKEVIAIMGNYRRRDWTEFAENGRKQFACTELYSLLDVLLVYDHSIRYTAKECMKHPYFDMVRGDIELEEQKRMNPETNQQSLLLQELEDLERGLKDRARFELIENGYDNVSILLESLRLLQGHYQNLSTNPTDEVIRDIKAFIESYENATK